MNAQQEIAKSVLTALSVGVVPWHFPFNCLPPNKALFGTYCQGEPLTVGDYSEIDGIVKATGVSITHHWRRKRPLYLRRPEDRIVMPPRSYFRDDPSYWACVIHEMVHWCEHRTGWSRPLDQGELVAESATGMIESFFRLPHDPDRTNLEKWLPAWEKGIQNDPLYLFEAVDQAQRAVRYLLKYRGKTREQVERELQLLLESVFGVIPAGPHDRGAAASVCD